MDTITTMFEYSAQWGFDFQQALSAQWLGIAMWQYVLAFVLLLLTLFARRIAALSLNRFVLPSVKRAGAVYTSQIIGALVKPLTAIVGLIGLYMASKILLLPSPGAPRNPSATIFIDQSFQVAIAVVIIWALMRLVNVFTAFLTERAKENDLPIDVPIIPLVQKSLKTFIGVIGGLLVIQQMGYPIASLLGGLGIGGLAVALAAQDTIANVFGSVIVFTDKPFKVGDWVKIGDVDGFVETIGFRSTRIRTWPKALVTLPNKTIANSQIENWSAMTSRQVSFTLLISYEATPDKIEELVRNIDELLANHPGVNQDFFVVSFRGFAENGLEVFIYYFTRSTAWKEHLQVRQEINVEIMRLLDKLGLSVALPSRRIYFSSPDNEMKMTDVRLSEDDET